MIGSPMEAFSVVAKFGIISTEGDKFHSWSLYPAESAPTKMLGSRRVDCDNQCGRCILEDYSNVLIVSIIITLTMPMPFMMTSVSGIK